MSAFDNYLHQMTYWNEHNTFEQTKQAESSFRQLFEQTAQQAQARYISNKVGIGIKPLSMEQIKTMQELRNQQNQEVQQDYRQRAVNELNIDFTPVVPICFDKIDQDQNFIHQTKLITKYEQNQDEIMNFKIDPDKANINKSRSTIKRENKSKSQKYFEYQINKPAISDFTPVAPSLLQARQQNLDLLRRAINTIIYENRAKTNLKKIQEQFGLRVSKEKVVVEDIVKSVINNNSNVEIIQRMGVNKNITTTEIKENMNAQFGEWNPFSEAGDKEIRVISQFGLGMDRDQEEMQSWDQVQGFSEM
ncbi:Hypothetical_protein [Hexamita inflata]|uniref:Hypothetical_protein n=1 Tax=Hexamita inflata TaxID=28002 RepID=A0AA86NUP4_9EUKA|nr:Hypothetical protein HINF_LOCUS12980 [Hexamita inflata]